MLKWMQWLQWFHQEQGMQGEGRVSSWQLMGIEIALNSIWLQPAPFPESTSCKSSVPDE
jgi:hypothetical protein